MSKAAQKNNTVQKQEGSSYSPATSSPGDLSLVIDDDEFDAPVMFTMYTLKSKMSRDILRTDNRTMFEAKKAFGLRDKYLNKIERKVTRMKTRYGRSGFGEPAKMSKWRYANCGEELWEQKAKDGRKRWLCKDCNERKYCPRCAKKYANRKSKKMAEIVKGVLRSKGEGEKYMMTPTFTIPKELSKRIINFRDEKRKEAVSDLHRAVAETLRVVFKGNLESWADCLGKEVEEMPELLDQHLKEDIDDLEDLEDIRDLDTLGDDDKMGIATVAHTWSSGKPWTTHLHIHSFLLSIYLSKEEEGEEEKIVKKNLPEKKRGFLSKKILAILRLIWTRMVGKRMAEYFPYDFQLPEELDAKYNYQSFEMKKGDRDKLTESTARGVKHKVNYALRPYLEDAWKAVAESKFPDEKIPEIADLLDKYRTKSEKIRYYGFWAKSVRRDNLQGHFGLRLVKNDGKEFEVVDTKKYIVTWRGQESLKVKARDSDRDETVFKERKEIKGEFSSGGGQMWEYPTGQDPPGEGEDTESEAKASKEGGAV